jgi:DeoR/GlpR family transcriptional regulator of sugar metabolism
MLAIERRNNILELVQEQKSVMVTDLSTRFNVTEETIRRDLEKLEKEGMIKRTYGGAVIKDSTQSDLPFKVRETKNMEGKVRIGAKVAEFIEDGDSIMLDSSSTALYVAKSIKNKKRLTVITNCYNIVLELSGSKDFRIICTGGTLNANAMSFVGHSAENFVQGYNADKAIISCNGMDIDKGITDSNEMEAEVKKSMAGACKQNFLAVDSTKFSKVSFIRLMDFNQVDYIVTDKTLSAEWEKMLKNKGIEIVYA